MPNNGAVTGEITDKETDYTVPLGFHDGSGKVGIATAEKSKIVAGNIKQGVTILGVEGTYSGNGVNLQAKTVTPSKTAQTVQADPGYDALSSVTVNAIPYTETDNAAGGSHQRAFNGGVRIGRLRFLSFGKEKRTEGERPEFCMTAMGSRVPA